MAKFLVIVESPAKAKTINKFLGPKYKVTACMGHIIDLPKSRLGVDVEDNFKPHYIVMNDRKKNLTALKKEAKGKEAVYLAADPDREGEAISWHLERALQEEGRKFFRVEFDEITKEAVKGAFNKPRNIDMHLVDAQQARRILDRIVGYTLSPLLWNKVSRGLSAGRVQSVALRLIVEREDEIKRFVPKEYWDMFVDLKRHEDDPGKKFTAKLDKYRDEKIEISDKADSGRIADEIKREQFIVSDIRESKKKKNPYPPFTTSKLQQEAFNKFRFSGARTMSIAQGLYEGIDIGGEGSVGLITYMRTDSVRISKEAQEDAKKYIIGKYGAEYYPEKPNFYKSRKAAQEAHEAIRPALPLRDPDSVKSHLTTDQFKLYQLIWNRFLASQMTSSVMAIISVDIKAGDYLFKVSSTKILFNGYSIVYDVENDGDVDKEEDDKKTLPPLLTGDKLDLLDILPGQHFTKPPPRYSDGSLVKALEELGIGRPSTYAPTIQTITSRDYVEREGGYFRPTELGVIVTKLLMEHFPKILDIEFTARLEDELDDIEEGKNNWVAVLKAFYTPFSASVEAAKEEMKNVKKELIATDEVCSLCGRPMVIKWGRRGKFLSCSGYPECKNAKSITTGVKCPTGCGGELVARKSSRGSFFGCSKYPKCTFIAKKLPGKDENPEEPSQSQA